MAKNPTRPRDPNQLAKFITDVIAGDKMNDKPVPATAGQRKGGLKGAKARTKKLSPEERTEIAKKAAAKRWSKS